MNTKQGQTKRHVSRSFLTQLFPPVTGRSKSYMGSYQYIVILTDNVGGTISITAGRVSVITKEEEAGDVIQGSFGYSIGSVVIK